MSGSAADPDPTPHPAGAAVAGAAGSSSTGEAAVAPLCEADLARMSQKQVVAHSAKVKRADITRLPTSDGWSWTPANLQADQAVAQENAWHTVWTDDEMKSVAEKVMSLRSELELSQEWPPEAMQDASSMMQHTRGCCEFHIVRIFERNRAQLFVDFSEERLKELKADLGKVAKDMPFDWLKERVIYLLAWKWRHERQEPMVAAKIEELKDLAWSYTEMNAHMPGGVPNTNVAQEATNQ